MNDIVRDIVASTTRKHSTAVNEWLRHRRATPTLPGWSRAPSAFGRRVASKPGREVLRVETTCDGDVIAVHTYQLRGGTLEICCPWVR